MIRTKLVFYSIASGCLAFTGCNYFANDEALIISESDSVVIIEPSPREVKTDTAHFDPVTVNNIEEQSTVSGNQVSSEQLLAYAETLIGTPYKYASIDPADGLDCSGFITHVFNHFSIQVPRSSIDFTNYGITIKTEEAKPGDLILFIGTDTLIEVVGHMGIVSTVTDEQLEFIHSTSGKAYGVTITAFNDHYRKRFVKVIRIPYTTTASL